MAFLLHFFPIYIFQGYWTSIFHFLSFFFSIRFVLRILACFSVNHFYFFKVIIQDTGSSFLLLYIVLISFYCFVISYGFEALTGNIHVG